MKYLISRFIATLTLHCTVYGKKCCPWCRGSLIEDIQVLSKREVMLKINYFSLFVGGLKRHATIHPFYRYEIITYLK